MKRFEIKADIREELKCEEAFIGHLERTGLIDKASEAMEEGDKAEAEAIMKEIRAEWEVWCKAHDDAFREAVEEYCDEEENE